MLVGIYDLKDLNGRDLESQNIYEKILAYNEINSVRLKADQADFWEVVESLSLFIMRFKANDGDLQLSKDLLPLIERIKGIKCLPNLNMAWHYDDKIKQYFLLESMGFPMTQSWVFWDKEIAHAWIERANFPVVFKLRGGVGSRNVVLVRNPKAARLLVNKMFGPGVLPGKLVSPFCSNHFSVYRELRYFFGNINRWRKGLDTWPYWNVHKNYALFQKFLPGNKYDTCVTVIGDRAFAFRRMAPINDFRASGTGRNDYDITQIDLRCIKIAFEVSKKMNFQTMTYDFLLNEHGLPEFCEISYTHGPFIGSCPGYWDSNLDWHFGKFSPEHMHLIDVLGLPHLQLPPGILPA